MRHLVLAEPSPTFLPRHRRSTLAIAAGMHVALFLLLIVVKTPPVRVSSLGSSYRSIAAYVAPARRARRAAAPRKTAPPTAAAETPTATEAPAVTEAPTATEAATATDAPQENGVETASAAGSTATVISQPPAGRVRLSNGATLTLLQKVPPIYPSVMQSARVSGLVVLDAVIRPDGTIGDVTVLRSTNDLFARAAIEAVKKWRYTPLPYEGIVTVTVNFNLT